MRSQNALYGAAALCVWLTAYPAFAQPATDAAQAQRDAAQAQAQAQRDAAQAQAQAQRQRESLEREIERAREQMESAAREVARLSAEMVGPVVNDVTRRFRYAGQRAMLGVNIEDTELGARVVGVSPNGPAAAAGLVVGDTIVAIDGAELAEAGRAGSAQQSPSELLLAQMANVEPGGNVELRVLRDGDYRNVQVQAREFQPGLFFEPHVPELKFPGANAWTGVFTRSRPWADMQLVALTPALGAYFGTEKGLLVVRAPKNAALALRDGDVILDIGGREPLNPEHAVRILASFEPGEPLRVTIMRQQRRETLEIQIPVEPPG
jgi:S1-C subfamily serine protease